MIITDGCLIIFNIFKAMGTSISSANGTRVPDKGYV